MTAKIGRPAFRATQDQRLRVTAMAASGIMIEHIARIIGVSQPTLRKYFGEELETAAAIANTQVAERLLDIARNGVGRESVTACIFWLKCRAGWREFPAPIGKKEMAEEAAKTAGVGSRWGNDLDGPEVRVN